MYFSSWRICIALRLVRYFSSSSGMMPSNVPPYFCDALPGPPGVGDVLVAGAPQPHAAQLVVKLLPRRFEQRPFGAAPACAPSSRRRRDRCAAATGPGPSTVPTSSIAPWANDLSESRTSRSGSKLKNSPSPSHVEAHALRAVEAEQLRRRLVEAQAAIGAGEVGGERRCRPAAAAVAARRFASTGRPVEADGPEGCSRHRCLPPLALPPSSSCDRDDQAPLPHRQRRVDRLGQPAADRRPGGEPVDDDFDVVPHLAVERRGRPRAARCCRRPARGRTPASAGPRTGRGTRPSGRESSGASTANCVFAGSRQDPADDLLAGLGRDRPAALRAVPAPHPGVEHPQEIVNLGDRADGRPRVVARRFLRDRDRRAEAADVVDLGLGHLAQELPGEGGQTLHVPPLALGVERVERQRALARAGHAGQANQLVSRQDHVDAPQVVLAGALDDDIGSGHRCPGGLVKLGRPRQSCGLAAGEVHHSTAQAWRRKDDDFRGGAALAIRGFRPPPPTASRFGRRRCGPESSRRGV